MRMALVTDVHRLGTDARGSARVHEAGKGRLQLGYFFAVLPGPFQIAGSAQVNLFQPAMRQNSARLDLYAGFERVPSAIQRA